MGVDIHTYVVKKKKLLAKDIYEGRNYEWFDALSGHSAYDDYDELPIKYYGIPREETPDEIYKKSQIDGYYGHKAIMVGDYIKWFYKHRPDLNAGWVTTYDKWRMEKKGWIPDDPKHFLWKDEDIQDYHFVEWTDPWNPDWNLVQYFREHDIPEDAYFIYWFDC